MKMRLEQINKEHLCEVLQIIFFTSLGNCARNNFWTIAKRRSISILVGNLRDTRKIQLQRFSILIKVTGMKIKIVLLQ